MTTVNQKTLPYSIRRGRKRDAILRVTLGETFTAPLTVNQWDGGSRYTLELVNLRTHATRVLKAGECVSLKDAVAVVESGVFMGKEARPTIVINRDVCEAHFPSLLQG